MPSVQATDRQGNAILSLARRVGAHLWSQNVLATGDPAAFLNNFFHTDGGSTKYNGGFSSTNVDVKLDALNVAEGHTARVAATAEAHAAILAEQPVSHLVTPYWHYSLSDRMVTEGYTAYGADYYIIHAEMFLTTVPVPAPVAPEMGKTLSAPAASSSSAKASPSSWSARSSLFSATTCGLSASSLP